MCHHIVYSCISAPCRVCTTLCTCWARLQCLICIAVFVIFAALGYYLYVGLDRLEIEMLA
jgi:hypothetical protein